MTSRKSIIASATALTLGFLTTAAASAADFSRGGDVPQPNAPPPSADNCDCPMMRGDPSTVSAAPTSGQRTHPGGTGSR